MYEDALKALEEYGREEALDERTKRCAKRLGLILKMKKKKKN
jgi:hypothetical protein